MRPLPLSFLHSAGAGVANERKSSEPIIKQNTKAGWDHKIDAGVSIGWLGGVVGREQHHDRESREQYGFTAIKMVQMHLGRRC